MMGAKQEITIVDYMVNIVVLNKNRLKCENLNKLF